MIQAHNIHKSYGTLEVLKGIDLTISQGEVVSIVGRSGAGKTTLLQILGTLDRADAGSVMIGGQDVGLLHDDVLSSFRNRHIGFVFQFHQLLPEFTALENVMLPAQIAREGHLKDEISRRSSHQITDEAMQLLTMLGVADRCKHRPAELSGGERQRVAVARALINHPDVIFADEPSGSLDSHNKQELHQLFFDLRKELNQTFVIVTHDESLASMSDRIIHMQDGLVVK